MKKAIKVQRNAKTEVIIWKLSDTCYKVTFENPFANIGSSYGTIEKAEEAFEYYCEQAKKY